MVEDMGLERPLRPSRRRCMKLEDPIRRFCAEQGINTWEEAAADRDAWSEMKQMFASWARGGKGSERQWECVAYFSTTVQLRHCPVLGGPLGLPFLMLRRPKAGLIYLSIQVVRLEQP